MDHTNETEAFLYDVKVGLERRLTAAVIDMVVISALCFAILQASGVLIPTIFRAAGSPAAILTGALFLLEASTGRSPGKVAMRLRIERMGSDEQNGQRASIFQTGARAAVRWLAPFLSLLSLLTKDLSIAGLLVVGGMTIVICEIPACYITLFRRGGTIFDLVARTRVASP